MRLIDADELTDRVWKINRDMLSSRELITQIINNTHTIEPPITKDILDKTDNWVSKRLNQVLLNEIIEILQDEIISPGGLVKVGYAIGEASSAVHNAVYGKNFQRILEFEKKK